jgi:hypothetical protein
MEKLDLVKLDRRARKTAAMRRWRAANPERSRATLNAWRRANPEKRRAQVNRWRLKHPEKCKAKQKRSYENLKKRRPDLIKKWKRNWYLKAKSTERFKARRRRERKAYVLRNIEKVAASKKLHAERARMKVTAGYARSVLRHNTALKVDQIPEPLVQLEIATLKLKRQIWQNRKTSTNSANNS